MLLEAFGSAVLGLILALAASRHLAHRLPVRSLVLATGVAGGLFGAFLTHSAVDSGGFLVPLLGAAVVSAASLSLLIRPARGLRRTSATA